MYGVRNAHREVTEIFSRSRRDEFHLVCPSLHSTQSVVVRPQYRYDTHLSPLVPAGAVGEALFLLPLE